MLEQSNSLHHRNIMSSSSSVEGIRDAACAVGVALGPQKYAVVGGAACVLLGSLRITTDVDLVVPQGKTVVARNKFRSSEAFTVDAVTAYTHYPTAVPVPVEVLTPPFLFQGRFDTNTPTITVQGVSVLKPALILNAKCGSIRNRGNEEKQLNDAKDIIFLLKYLANIGTKPTAAEVPAATKFFFRWFIGKFHEEDAWIRAGYDGEKGQSECFL